MWPTRGNHARLVGPFCCRCRTCRRAADVAGRTDGAAAAPLCAITTVAAAPPSFFSVRLDVMLAASHQEMKFLAIPSGAACEWTLLVGTARRAGITDGGG